MATGDFFIKPKDGFYRFDPTIDNGATVFYDNAAFYQAILKDLRAAQKSHEFVYFVGWWSDLRLPLGDPKMSPTPPTFGGVIDALARGLPARLPELQSSPQPLGRQPGPQICCMLWQHKGQWDFSGPPIVYVLPDSLFGAPVLAAINTATVKTVNYLPGNYRGILDKRHAIFGSHHQKFSVLLTDAELVAYVGSSDYNADRLYPMGDPAAPSAPIKGAPLNDVNVRLTGPVAVDVLKTFVDRWQAHPDGQDVPLKGASYQVMQSSASQGAVQAQLSHTYAKGYPFPTAVRSAADIHLNICRTAMRYVYFEDQYLIGTPEMWVALRDKLASNIEFVVIAVMAPHSVVTDMPWLMERRSDFWQPLFAAYPGRVLLFEMLAPDGTDYGAGAYLHNKMTIADDAVVTFGSVNFSRRSHTHDSEVMVALGGQPAVNSADIALQVRTQRWSRHLGVALSDRIQSVDAIASFRRLPLTARIRQWTPTPSVMSPAERAAYTRLYDLAIDPA